MKMSRYGVRGFERMSPQEVHEYLDNEKEVGRILKSSVLISALLILAFLGGFMVADSGPDHSICPEVIL